MIYLVGGVTTEVKAFIKSGPERSTTKDRGIKKRKGSFCLTAGWIDRQRQKQTKWIK